MSPQTHTSGAAPPSDFAAAATNSSYSLWRFSWAFVLGLLITAIFFRSLLPRLPRVLFRGKLRIQRAGLRGIRGIEYRSKGFHNDSAAFSRNENQLEVKIQRIYTSYHLPYFLCRAKHKPSVVPKKSGAIITIHVQGVGVRLPRSSKVGLQHKHASPTTSANRDAASETMFLEQQEELRLQRLMSSPSMSPLAESSHLFSGPRTFTSSMDPSFSSLRQESQDKDAANRTHQRRNSGLYLTLHSAGLMSIHTVLGLAKWFRFAAVPTLSSVALRAFRAAIFILTSSLPMLTSLVSIEVDRIEIYLQEAEAVARVGRAGLTFSMSPDSLSSDDCKEKVQQGDDAAEDHSRSSYSLHRPSWGQFFYAMRMMPTRVGSGARGAANYLLGGMSPSHATAHIRIDCIELFEANFRPDTIPNLQRGFGSRRNSAADSSRPPTPLSTTTADRGVMPPSQSNVELDTTEELAFTYDNSFERSCRLSRATRERSNSASRLSRMSHGSLRGFADRWADWALEPLVESDFHADSGWTRQHLDNGGSPHQLQKIPSSARIMCITGVSELTASLLVGSNFALGGDRTLAAKLALGSTAIGLDAVHRVMCIAEERKARRTGWAPSKQGISNDQRSVISKHLVQQRSSASTTALRIISSVAFSLPSVCVTASSDHLLSSAAACAAEAEKETVKDASLPSRELAISLAGFSFELRDSNPNDDLHRRWLGTCGLSSQSPVKRDRRDKKDSRDKRSRKGSFLRGSATIEHRRIFLAELSLASFDISCWTCGSNRGSQLLFVGDFSVVARSSWTPFGLFETCPEALRLLFAGDPNEHATTIEAAIGGVESDVSMNDITALVPIANEFSRRRQMKRERIGIEEPARPKTDIERFRSLPRIAAGFHVQRISLSLDASQDVSQDAFESSSESSKSQRSRKLILSVPNVDFVFLGEYRDEYVKRPSAEKRAAYKALKSDNLEWPISGSVTCVNSKRGGKARSSPDKERPQAPLTEERKNVSVPTTPHVTSFSSQRYAETNLSMAETLKRMRELQEMHAERERPPVSGRRPSLRETMSKKGKVRLPGYSRRTSMAAETRFSLRYQFETSLRVDAVESFLSLSSDPKNSTSGFLRPQSFKGTSDTSQHHLLAMHSFEVLGSGRIPGHVEYRGSPSGVDIPVLSASDAMAEFRASVEDVDIEAWQMSALETYAEMAAAIIQAKQKQKTTDKQEARDDRKSAPNHGSGRDGAASGNVESRPKPLVERLPGGLAVYFSIGRTIAHLGGPDRRIKDKVARGVGFGAERIVLEYVAVTETKTNAMPQKPNWGARTALELSEDLQLQAVSLAARHGRVGLGRIVMHQAGIFPILDAELATQQHTEGTASETFAQAKAPQGEIWPEEDPANESADRPATSLLADGVWSFSEDDKRVHKSTQHRPKLRQQDRSNFIFFMPYAAFKAVVRPPQAENESGLAGACEDEVTITTEDTNLLAFNIDLLHTYCFLLAFSTFKHLAARAKSAGRPAAAKQPAQRSDTTQKPASVPKRTKPSISCRIDIKEVHTFVTLPRSTRIFMRIRRLEVRRDLRKGLSVSTESIMGAVESPKQSKNDLWEEAVRLRDWIITLPPQESGKKLRIIANGDGALVRIPFGYTVFPIIDNTTVAIKATKQLVHQFLHDTDDSIITPQAEDPKLLPDIDINIRVLTLEAEDDPFETKLNLIWRAGFAENLAREEREVAFAAKAEAISASKMPQSSTSLRSSHSGASIAFSASSMLTDLNTEEDHSGTRSHDGRSTSKQEHVSYEEARVALDAFNSSSWVRRYLNAHSEQTRRQENTLKNIYGRFTLSRSLDALPVKVLPIGKAAPLFRSTMYRVGLGVRQAHFPLDTLRDFIFEKGAGVPKDTPYSLVIPMHMKWDMEEWRITLRDYPMPMLHVPPTHRTDDDARRAWCFEGDIVVAEQLGGPESIRHVPAVIVPAATGRPGAIEYGIVIPKVAMSVKMYGTPTVKLRTPFPTRLVWGQSIQPTIQDVMRVIDGVTSPPHDPSPKLGFWDKLPLILHGHVNFKFEDEGGFNIHLKGSRDPYTIEGHAAGWVKAWKGNVELRIGYDNPENEFFQILSHEYVLAVPDLCDYVDHAATGVLGGGDHSSGQRHHSHSGNGEESYHDSYDRKSVGASVTSSMYRYMKDPTFRKIVIKLTNGVRWGAGLHGERTCDDETCPRRPQCKGESFYRECREFKRINHWDVIPKTHEYFDSIPESERRDSFRGWRSHHLHLSLSIFSPKNGIRGYGYEGSGHVSHLDAVNNFYFSPLAWQHFWAWMRLFNSAMSLPIRTGELFPDSPPPSPKFGRFLGTIKYRIDLEPLFITHQYRQFNKKDWAKGLRTHVGIKARIDSFTLDMHQRQQETVKDRPELGGPRIVFHKPFYEAEVKCDSIDLRTLAARMREDGYMSEMMEDQEVGQDAFDDVFAGEVDISDEELVWIDMNDLVELDASAITDPSPKIRMFPAMVCPRFNYYRKVESKREHRAREMQDRAADGRSHSDGNHGIEDLLDRLERSKFGNERTHTCMVGQNDRPHGVQRKLAQERLQVIRREIDHILNSGDDAATTSGGSSENSDDHQDRLSDLHNRERILSGFISHLGRLQEHIDRVERAKAHGTPLPTRSATLDYSLNGTDLASLYHDLGKFDNRYIAHNPTLFFSNVTRTLLLKYYYSSRLRRGYAHHMTATAVRYIRDLLKRKDKNGKAAARPKQRHQTHSAHSGKTPQQVTPSTEGTIGINILHEMLEDTVNHMFGKDGYSTSGWGCRSEDEGEDGMDAEMRPTDGISDDFNVVNSNVCLLLKPQVVLRSDVDDKSTVIVTALRTRLQNYTVQDESCAEDSVNAIVLRRNFFALDNLQCYHPNALAQSKIKKQDFMSLPLEALVDMHGHARDFERIVPHTNATMYYDKFNKLRLSDSSRSVSTFRKDGKPVQDHLHHHMDMIVLNCPRFSVSANGEHFAALYNVVTDLILHRDPAHRDHAKRLEEMMFSYDFTDVSGLADIVSALQVRIRDARSLAEQYQAVADRLNERGKADFVALLGEMLDLVEELNLIMDAITTSQDSKGGADREKKSALRFMTQAQEVAWNMIGDEAGHLVAKLALRGISFSWLNKADNSAANTLSIRDLQALNVDPNAMFAEIITKYNRASEHPMAKEGRFLDAMWSVLPPVGGISIVDMFEFNLHPVKIQIELLVGRKIMDYIFGTKRQREKQEEEQKRLENENNHPENAAAKKKSPFARLLGRQKHLTSSSATTSSQDAHRRSTNESSLGLSAADARSRSASSTDLRSFIRPSSDGSREEDADSISGRASTKAMISNPATTKNSLKSRPSTPSSGKEHATGNDRPGDQFAIAQKNAAEMRSRASAYRTFVYVKISETIFCLSYKGEKQTSITNLYDLVFRTPNFEYHNSTFGYVDLADSFKKDVFKAAWNQKSTLLRDIITHRPNRKRNAIESIRAIRQASKARESLAPLDISVHPPSSADRSSFDGSSHLVDSPTDTFSYRETEQYDGESGGSRDSPEVDRNGDDDDDDDKYGHARTGTSQTLAGQIRDAWGRSNEASYRQDDNASVHSDEMTRHSTSEVDDLLRLKPVPQGNHDTPANNENKVRRFPNLARPFNTDITPSAERGETTTLHSSNSTNSSPYLQLLNPASSVGTTRRGSTSTRSHSPSSFKLGKLIPKPFRQRANSNSGSLANETKGSGSRAGLHANGNKQLSASPLGEHYPQYLGGEEQQGVQHHHQHSGVAIGDVGSSSTSSEYSGRSGASVHSHQLSLG
ncbi:uncharacterized protein MEPE_04321 [Melanopsichium pennsylvanicum]|uniref:Uncharacterized protein n=2 Tax=Melanopsichium pennsylvanicum TaxID=63383 RepID=A0AAJ4XNS5_9BASI|nr:conserved hypothetical protein [Melanopsichium pennsylvanicum 4]SNX85612.1 uncharacterized protein MEPE_04321 [Melanopsichium pennsylvanicum]